MSELLGVDEVIQHVLSRIVALSVEDVPTVQALGRVLAADVTAQVNVPPFANSSRDGYAVRCADTGEASPQSPVHLSVTMDIPAGSLPPHALRTGEAARIMTGALLPDGADAVIPVEQTDDTWISDGSAILPDTVAVYRSLDSGANVRLAGEDMHAGQIVLRAGTVLRPQDIGVLVILGQVRVSVFRQPRVTILATGDELVDIDDRLQPGQIRNSNSYVLAGLVTACGGIPIRLPVARDNLDDVRRLFREALSHQPDLIISSAGVSAGTRDVVRAVVDELGRVDVWRVNLRPGKPIAFGYVQQVPFFGLPGNPVSAMVTFDVFVRPTLLKQGGRAVSGVPEVTAVTSESIVSDGRRSYLRVTLAREGQRIIARLTGTQSSGALLSMVLADGLLIVPEGVTEVSAGTEFQVRLLRDFLD